MFSCFSRVQLFAIPWTIVPRTPLSMGFPRREYWSGLPFPSPGDFRNPRTEPGSPVLQANSLLFEPPGKTSAAKSPAICSVALGRGSHLGPFLPLLSSKLIYLHLASVVCQTLPSERLDSHEVFCTGGHGYSPSFVPSTFLFSDQVE